MHSRLTALALFECSDLHPDLTSTLKKRTDEGITVDFKDRGNLLVALVINALNNVPSGEGEAAAALISAFDTPFTDRFSFAELLSQLAEDPAQRARRARPTGPRQP